MNLFETSLYASVVAAMAGLGASHLPMDQISSLIPSSEAEFHTLVDELHQQGGGSLNEMPEHVDMNQLGSNLQVALDSMREYAPAQEMRMIEDMTTGLFGMVDAISSPRTGS
jgi:hypothetical protein